MIVIMVWGGDTHDKFLMEYQVETWGHAVKLIEDQVESGNLCGVVHSDFIPPKEKVQAALDRMIDREFFRRKIRRGRK